MPRRLRFASGGFVYHVLNRAVARARIFDKSMDYAAFERVLKQADAFVPMRLATQGQEVLVGLHRE